MTNDHDFVLERGTHKDVYDGACLLEAVSYVAGERWSDRPECVCPVLAAYGRTINDHMGDADRQLLVPLIPRLVGTRGSHDLTLRRMYLLVDRSVRQIVPLVLRDLGEPALALMLESIPPIVDGRSARAAEPLCRAVRDVAGDYAIAYVADADDSATYAADATFAAVTAAAAAAARRAATSAAAAAYVAMTSEHTALVVAAFVEAIDLARTVES